MAFGSTPPAKFWAWRRTNSRVPAHFLQRYQDGIRAVTKSDVVRVAKQYLKSDQFAILVLGKEKFPTRRCPRWERSRSRHHDPEVG